jgi:hypothetical protein
MRFIGFPSSPLRISLGRCQYFYFKLRIRPNKRRIDYLGSSRKRQRGGLALPGRPAIIRHLFPPFCRAPLVPTRRPNPWNRR